MRIDEFDSSMPKGLYDPTSDLSVKANMMTTRKEKLSLRDLNRLKKIRAFQRLEDLKRQDIISVIYAQASEDDGGGDF